MSIQERVVRALLGFREGNEGFPCWFFGVFTTVTDAEDFHVCVGCQKGEIEIGYEAMKIKYPHTGEDARNPEFFEALKSELANQPHSK